MLKISLLFKKFTNLQENNLIIPMIKNARFSGYCFYMNTNISRFFKPALVEPGSIKSNDNDILLV